MPKLLNTTDFPWPLPDEEVRAALEAAYQDGSWGRYDGPHCAGLRDDLRAFFGCDELMLCSSGTVAVELALRGCGVSPGDEVVLAGYDFPGNFRAIEAIGARPVLIDVDPHSWCLNADCLAQVTGKRVRAVIVSHLHGGLADMPRIMQLAHKRGWQVVEDACQQPGGQLENRPVGMWGDVGVLSFGGSKLLTAGRGGALITNNRTIHQRAKIFAQRGNDAFPLSELQGAVLRPQLAKLPGLNRRRAKAAAQFQVATASWTTGSWTTGPWTTELRAITHSADSQPAYYKLAWSYLPAEEDPTLRAQLIGALNAIGLPIGAGFRGFTRRVRQDQQTGREPTDGRCRHVGILENSERLSHSTVLLHHPILLASPATLQQATEALASSAQSLH
ncbi:MAG: aminotransferase class V-fold PLP-dependent enzyme [Pirellulales bacterium]